MRIIGGRFKGRILRGKAEARPTTGFAKESLFNILENYFHFDQIEILDLFAGTGSISFEFASRGCNNVELVEVNARNYKFICENIKSLQTTSIKAIKSDALYFLQQCYKQYDIIFADPPFDWQDVIKIPDLVFERQLIRSNGMLIIEHSKSVNFQHHPHFWQIRNYGAVHFSFFLP